MIVEFTETAKKEFLSLDKSQQIQFKKALDKLKDYSSQKHLNYGIPAFVIKVNKQARIIYNQLENTILVLHCFAKHDDYERWYKT